MGFQLLVLYFKLFLICSFGQSFPLFSYLSFLPSRIRIRIKKYLLHTYVLWNLYLLFKLTFLDRSNFFFTLKGCFRCTILYFMSFRLFLSLVIWLPRLLYNIFLTHINFSPIFAFSSATYQTCVFFFVIFISNNCGLFV